VPGEQRLKKLSKLLNKHHIFFFSAGGNTTEDNLIVVCPNCHSLIHDDPTSFSPRKLRAIKKHWKDMASVVPNELKHPLALSMAEQVKSVSVVLETVNLKYQILAPTTLSVGELSEFVANQIVSPLGKFDNNEDWCPPMRLELALASNPGNRIAPEKRLEEIRIKDGDALTVLIEAWTQLVCPPIDRRSESLRIADYLYDYVGTLLRKMGDEHKIGSQGPFRVAGFDVYFINYGKGHTRILDIKSSESEITLYFEVKGWVNLKIDGKERYDFKHFGRFPDSIARTPDAEKGDRMLMRKIAEQLERVAQAIA
jgi:HNH endonuclease